MQQQPDTPVVPEGNSELVALFNRLWSGKWWIVAGAVVAGTIAGVSAFTTPPVYRATTLLAAAETDRRGLGGSLGAALGSIGGLASLAGVNVGGADASIEEALAVLKSREFTEAFISQHNVLPDLFPGQWDAAKKVWTGPPDERPTLTRAYKRFDREVRSVNRDKKTGLILVQIDWTDRKKAAEWANQMVTQLNAEMRARAITQTEASLGYLERELGTTTVIETRQAISGLMEAQIKQRMLANVTQEYVFRVIDKAMMPDLSDKVRPKRLLMLCIGILLGAALGLAALLCRDFARSVRRAP